MQVELCKKRGAQLINHFVATLYDELRVDLNHVEYTIEESETFYYRVIIFKVLFVLFRKKE